MLEQSDTKNKIQLESQILTEIIRKNIDDVSKADFLQATSKLYQLFPDLMPANIQIQKEVTNYYEVFSLPFAVSQFSLVSAYLKKIKQCLIQWDLNNKRDAYINVLNAGFVLRKNRLRISHDLVLARAKLIAAKQIQATGMFEPLEKTQSDFKELKEMPSANELPKLVQLLKAAQFINEAEIQALSAQMVLAPEVPIEKLVLSSGYASQMEINSLKLAEMLLADGKITMAQFQVAIYDERVSGTHMAESLQVRGWLETHVDK